MDVVNATFISAFNGNGTDPTLGTNLSYIAPVLAESVGGAAVISGNAVNCSLSSSWQRFSATFVVPSNCVNIIPMIWSNATLAANDDLLMTEAGLYIGQEIRDWVQLPFSVELKRCMRFFAKTFPYGTVPAQSGGLTNALKSIAGKAAATAQLLWWQYPVKMRATPTTLTLYNPSAANAQVRDTTAAADCSASTTANVGDGSTDITATGNGSTAVGNTLAIHVTADAEI